MCLILSDFTTENFYIFEFQPNQFLPSSLYERRKLKAPGKLAMSREKPVCFVQRKTGSGALVL